MPQKKIPLKDKEMVKQRVMEGKSYSEAMKGTEVASKSTVHEIVQREKNDIERERKEYLALIEQEFGADNRHRAEQWAKMTKHTEWRAQAESLKYIDNLKGFSENAPQVNTQVNVFNQLGGKADEIIEGDE